MVEEVKIEEVTAEEVKVHNISLSMVKTPPAEVDAGTFIALQGRVSCPSACDLRGKIVRIITQDAVVAKEIRLVTFDGTAYETDPIVIKSPTEPGVYTWTAVFPAQEKEGVLHEEGSAPFTFTVKPHHATSMAIWDVPSPIAFGDEFRIKVGVKCSAECNLAGKEVEIYGQEGTRVATGTLSDVPYSDTVDLYWTEIELKAPGTEGYYRWQAKFPEPDLEFQHEEASHPFGFITGKPPEHVVTIEVIDKDTKTPIKNADVLLHPYRGYTNDYGVAKVEVPKGNYELYVSKNKYQIFQTTVEVANDVAVKVELLVVPYDPNEEG